jgi:threonyl-tRNA synthetase
MVSLEQKRHTLAHLLASVVCARFPHAKPAIGPTTEHGFYYDFDFGTGEKPTEKDLVTLEKAMQKELALWEMMQEETPSPEEAKKRVAGNTYKEEILGDIVAKGETATFYTSLSTDGVARFSDLCRGGHSEHPAREIAPDSFVLERVAGAYWRGDEKNTMLTRIYGLAFETKEELETYRARIEEAKKRDHRKLGKELDLFTFSDLVGAGLPLWTPRGALVRDELDRFVWSLREKHGYQRVSIPHITKRDLYEKSGHWEKFSEELFRITTREGKEYALKPMNCPHHTQIFARHPHSYRDMPQRYAETTMVYRDEQSGELGGLTRVLSITQDDAHVFCRSSQVKEEFLRIWDIVETFYGAFGITLQVRISLHDPAHPEKYLGTKEVWASAESILRDIAKSRALDYFEAEGESAMYGPKLDFMGVDSLGRKHQVATIQLDMNLPERFDLSCINEQGEKERIVMIHAAIMGSIERFTAVLLEHTGGAFPLWLSPIQVAVLPVGQVHHAYADTVATALRSAGLRVETRLAEESLGKRIRATAQEKVPYRMVLGDTEMTSATVKLEHRDGSSRTLPLAEVCEVLKKEVTERVG